MTRKVRSTCVIGTRGSPLAMIQAETVRSKIHALYPQTDVTVQIITTTGDKNQSPIPLDTIGKAWFSREIEQALLHRSIDLAVHSLKDLPEVCPKGLMIAAILKREDSRDVIVSAEHVGFSRLPSGSVIGTDSARRQAQILALRPDLTVRSIRGNIQTRLDKLDRGEYSAIILAAAGLMRLNKTHRITEYFSTTVFLPAPGQGALAVQIRTSDHRLLTMIRCLNHATSALTTSAERTFAHTVGSGCKTPVAALATIHHGEITVSGMIASADGAHMQKDMLKGPVSQAQAIGKKLAKKMLHQCAAWYKTPHPLIVLTRPGDDSVDITQQLHNRGFRTYAFPCIRIVPVPLTKKQTGIGNHLEAFDWIIFTSSNGVAHALTLFPALSALRGKNTLCRIAAVGPKTASVIQTHGLFVDFIPTAFETAGIAREMPDVRDKKILLLRSALATYELDRALTSRGATTVSIPVYTAEYVPDPDPEFKALVAEDRIHLITFASASTVAGFLHRTKHLDPVKIRSIPALCIGPVTAACAGREGFTSIHTSPVYTFDGMIQQVIRIFR